MDMDLLICPMKLWAYRKMIRIFAYLEEIFYTLLFCIRRENIKYRKICLISADQLFAIIPSGILGFS
jgi:hypothetical protein